MARLLLKSGTKHNLWREMNPMTTAVSTNKKGRRIRRAPVRKARGAGKASPPRRKVEPEKPAHHNVQVAGTVLLSREQLESRKPVAIRESTRSAQEFISDIDGGRTRWPMFIAASVLIVCTIGFLASRILIKEPPQAGVTSDAQVEQRTGSDVFNDMPELSGQARATGGSQAGADSVRSPI